MDQLNERSTHYLTVEFLDKTGALAAPTAVTYRIDCLTTGVVVRNDTAIGAGSTIEITLTPTDNAMQNQDNVTEHRRVTVIGQYGGSGDQVVKGYDYILRNMVGVS